MLMHTAQPTPAQRTTIQIGQYFRHVSFYFIWWRCCWCELRHYLKWVHRKRRTYRLIFTVRSGRVDAKIHFVFAWNLIASLVRSRKYIHAQLHTSDAIFLVYWNDTQLAGRHWVYVWNREREGRDGMPHVYKSKINDNRRWNFSDFARKPKVKPKTMPYVFNISQYI